MKIQTLDLSYAMQLAVLDQKLMYEENIDHDYSLVQLEIRMKSWLSGNYTAIGIVDSGLLIGFCLYREEQSIYSVHKLYVMESERRKGIATALVSWVSDLSDEKSILLPEAARSEVAIAFYNALADS